MHKLVWIYLTCVLAHKLFLSILTFALNLVQPFECNSIKIIANLYILIYIYMLVFSNIYKVSFDVQYTLLLLPII